MLHFTWVSTIIPSTHEALPRSTGDRDMKIERREISQKETAMESVWVSHFFFSLFNV